MAITFIHTGDVHIGKPFKSLPTYERQIRRKEVLNTFLGIVDYADRQQVDFLFIAGDLLDSDDLTRDELKAMRDAFASVGTIHICIIAGNHDPLLGDQNYYEKIGWSSNVHLLKDKPLHFRDKSTVVYGESWKEKYNSEDSVNNIQKANIDAFHILVAHGDIYTNSHYSPINKEKLIKKNFDYVCLGHMHKMDMINSRIAYCGSPEALSFGEEGIHGFIEGKIDDKHNIKTKFMESAFREYKHLSISCKVEDKEKDILHKILEHINEKNLYRCSLEGFKSMNYLLDIDYITRELGNSCFYIEIQDKRENNSDIDYIRALHKDDFIGLFIQRMEEEDLEDRVNKRALELGLEILLKEEGMGL